jgi:nucleotide-binding universal stress UspA family protein
MNWPPKRILVGTDFSETARAALRAAGALARRTGAALDLVHAARNGTELVTGYAPLDALLLRAPDPAEARAHVESQLAALAKDLEPLAVKRHLVRGEAAPELVALRELLRADLVVLGSVGLRGLRRFILGSVADRVLRRPGCPLLLVKESPATGEFKTIVVAQEYPDRPTAWLEVALQIAHAERAELVLLHVLPPKGYASDSHHVDLEPERAPEKLEALVAQLDATVPVRIETRRGDAGELIAPFAREAGADLLVMGAERHADGWPGRVTDRVARSGLPALLVVWPEAETEEEFEGDDA